MNHARAISGWCLGLGLLANVAQANPLEQELEWYFQPDQSNSVSTLLQTLQKSAPPPQFASEAERLAWLLKALNVPVSSQILVTSKTSPNKDSISAHTPRAIFFNDSVSVAYVPGTPRIEIAAFDAALGVVFYTMEQQALAPHLARDNRCIDCHSAVSTLNQPGLLSRSFATRPNGEVDFLSGVTVDHSTPFAERWGGYYVTGYAGSLQHRGIPLADIARDKYPAATSDIVALLVFEHQAHMQNLLARLGRRAREPRAITELFADTEAVLRYMLFADEAPWPPGLEISSAFCKEFAAAGPCDKQGRSLREFDLKRRLFKYPCSYMVYSPAFATLPDAAKKHIYRRLEEILSPDQNGSENPLLSADDRRNIREILLDTKTDLPIRWRL